MPFAPLPKASVVLYVTGMEWCGSAPWRLSKSWVIGWVDSNKNFHQFTQLEGRSRYIHSSHISLVVQSSTVLMSVEFRTRLNIGFVVGSGLVLSLVFGVGSGSSKIGSDFCWFKQCFYFFFCDVLCHV